MSKNKEIILEVTQEMFEEMKAKGIDEDAILKPGKHIFTRGGFQERHPNFNPKEAKMRINICLDADVVHHFRKRAESPYFASYQTQINNELRTIMERDLVEKKAEIDETAKKLLDDDEFLTALAEKLKEKELQTA